MYIRDACRCYRCRNVSTDFFLNVLVLDAMLSFGLLITSSCTSQKRRAIRTPKTWTSTVAWVGLDRPPIFFTFAYLVFIAAGTGSFVRKLILGGFTNS